MLSAVFYGFCRLIVFQQAVDRRAGAGNPDRGIAGDDPAAAVHQQVGREHIKVANRTEDSRRSEVEQETFAGDFTLADHFARVTNTTSFPSYFFCSSVSSDIWAMQGEHHVPQTSM